MSDSRGALAPLDTSRLPPLRVSPAAADEISGAVSALGAGLAGLIGATVGGHLSIVYLGGAFAVGAGAGVVGAIRRSPETEKAGDVQVLPVRAVIRPAWLAAGWVALHVPILCALGFAACYFSRWGIVGAGGVAALATHPLLSWWRVREWQRDHRTTLYYERMPLLTGGVSARYSAQPSSGSHITPIR